MAVASLAVLVGSAEAVRPVRSMAELADLVDLAHISRAPAKFDEAELTHLNARLLHEMPYEAAKERLLQLGMDDEAFWLAVRGNLERFDDVEMWWRIVRTAAAAMAVSAEPGAAFWAAARETLPSEPWDATTWKAWTDAVKTRTGTKGRALFMPLRQALTGLDHGPELAALLPLIGREQVLERLSR